MAPIGVGIIGLSSEGWAAGVHVPALNKLKDQYKLVALSTSKENSATTAGLIHSCKAYHGDPSQIANDPAVNLVVVSVRVPAHRQSLWPALTAGKDVFCEWPLGRDLEEAREITAYAAEKGVRTMCGLQARQGRAVRTAKEFVESGKIGRVLCTSMIGSGGVWGAKVQQRNSYLCDVTNGATLLSIPTSHALDAFSHVLGDFTSVSALILARRSTITIIESGQQIPQTTPDQVIIQGELKSGAAVSLHFRGGGSYSEKGGTDFYWEILGENGIITLKGPSGHIQMVEPKLYLDGEEVVFEGEDILGNVGREYKAFAEKSTDGYVTFEHAVSRHELLNAIETSAREGRRVII